MKHLKKGDQFVVACIDSPASANAVIAAARYFAERLRDKQLMLMNVSPKEKAEWIKDYGIPYVAMQGDWATAIEGLPTAFNAVLAVTAVDASAPRSSITNPNTLLRAFRRCKIAYLAVPKDTEAPKYQNTALTVDYQRESKEKLIWASYLERFCRSNVVVYHHPYSDPAFRQRLNNNIRYLEKTFASLGLSFELQELPQGSQFGDPDLKAIRQPEIDLFISLVADARERDLLDFFTPPPPLKLIRKAPQTPILFLNQRDDLYIMCD